MAASSTEDLVFRILGDGTQYEKTLKDAEKATETFTKGVVDSGSSLKNFSSILDDTKNASMRVLETVGANEWFKEIAKDSEGATTGIKKFGESIQKWAGTTSLSNVLADLQKMFTGLQASLNALTVDTVPEMFASAWKLASAAVVGALASVKASVLAVSAAILASPLMAVGVVVGIAGAVLVGLNALANYRNRAKELQDEFDQNKKDREATLAEDQKRTSDVIQRSNLQTGSGREETIKKELQKAEEEHQKVLKARDKAKADMKGIESTALFADPKETKVLDASIWDKFGWTERGKQAREALKGTQEELDRVNGKMEELTNQLKLNEKEAVNAVGGLRKEFELTGATIGMSAREAKVALAQMKINSLDVAASVADLNDDWFLAEEMWAEAEVLQRQLTEANLEGVLLEQALAVQKVKDEVKQLNESLQEQVDKLGMTNEEYKIWKIQQDAIKAGTIISDEELAKLKDLQLTLKQNKDFKKVEEAAKATTKKFATPEEKYIEEAMKLDQMLTSDLITQQVYNKALEQTRKKFDEAANGAKGAYEQVAKFDAALVGSAEAAQRIQLARERLDLRYTNRVPKVEQFLDPVEKPMNKADRPVEMKLEEMIQLLQVQIDIAREEGYEFKNEDNTPVIFLEDAGLS
jgi:hypothetical protein